MVSHRVSWAGVLLLAVVGCETRNVVTVEVETVELSPSSATLPEGDSRDFQAIPRAAGGRVLTGRSVTWSVRNPGVASVDGTGRLSALSEGQTTVEATVEGVVGSAPVSVIPGPSIELSETAVTLEADEGGASGPKAVGVANGGNGQLSGLSVRVTYAAGGPTGWLSAGLDRTTAPATLTLSASAAGMVVGTYEATVSVESPVLGGLTETVAIRFEVVPPPPTIVLDIEDVAFGALEGGVLPAVQAIAVTNGGGGVLSALTVSVAYETGEPEGWLEATLASAVAPTILTLEARPGNLLAGTYHASVSVASVEAPGGPLVVPVEFTVASNQP